MASIKILKITRKLNPTTLGFANKIRRKIINQMELVEFFATEFGYVAYSRMQCNFFILECILFYFHI